MWDFLAFDIFAVLQRITPLLRDAVEVVSTAGPSSAIIYDTQANAGRRILIHDFG